MQVAVSVSQSESVARAWVLAQPIVDALVWTAVRNQADALNTLQDVAVAILDGNHRSPANGEFTAWAIGVARHKVSDHFRRMNRRQVIMGDEGKVHKAYCEVPEICFQPGVLSHVRKLCK
jgi:DNA-directed RNA polymerase specialized sigma24 family protein